VIKKPRKKEETKARYRAVKIQPQWVVMPGKQTTATFCYKTLHVSGILSAHHQEFSTVHSALLSFMQVFDDRFQVVSGWNSAWKRSSKTCMKLTSAECTVENS